MEYTQLGRTGLKVSVIGLGGGGHSRLGLKEDERRAEEVVETALNLGINCIDTAELYGTEEVIGRVIGNRKRDELVLSTKYSLRRDGELRDVGEVRTSLLKSLEHLGTDYVDIYHLHAVRPKDYDFAVERLLPELLLLKEEGLIHHTGITEGFSEDPGHRMLNWVVRDGRWEVIMVGFNLLNQSARERILPLARRRGIGTLNMFAVRRALSNKDVLRKVIRELSEEGTIDDKDISLQNPLGFLVHERGAENVIDAAYRFCRHEPGIDVVLSGTSSPEHLRENVRSCLRPPLPERDRLQLKRIFSKVDSISGN